MLNSLNASCSAQVQQHIMTNPPREEHIQLPITIHGINDSSHSNQVSKEQ
jgi:hypothetical protein